MRFLCDVHAGGMAQFALCYAFVAAATYEPKYSTYF
jgi:hypothetical protein